MIIITTFYSALQKTNAPTLNLNISESSRARAKLQTTLDEKLSEVLPQTEIVQKCLKITKKIPKNQKNT